MQRLVALLLLGACAHSEDTPPKAPASSITKSASTPARATNSPLSPESKQKLCASEFGVERAEILVFRDSADEIKLLVLTPDLSRFSHAPWTYYSPSGDLLLTVPERPMTKEEREKDPVIIKLEALKKGLIEDEEGVACR